MSVLKEDVMNLQGPQTVRIGGSDISQSAPTGRTEQKPTPKLDMAGPQRVKIGDGGNAPTRD
jgi:hypothetical protein